MSCRALRLFMLLVAACSAAPAAAVEVSAEFGIVSDYRYRGISLSNGKPATQGSVTLEHDSGAYASLWGSSVADPADVELDVTGGYAFDIAAGLSLDLSATYYAYPSEPGSNYAEATAALERSESNMTFTAGVSFVPKQSGSRDEVGTKRRNSYLFAGASYELKKAPLTLSAQIGRERGIFDEVEHGGKWDWCLGANLKLDRLRIGITYSGSDAGKDAAAASLFVDF